MNTADTLMVVYYVVLSGVLVFTLGILAGWRYTGSKPHLILNRQEFFDSVIAGVRMSEEQA